jgi:hypothetical protein
MVHINNRDAIRLIQDGAKVSISEGFPTELSMAVVPVMDMTPDLHRVADICEGASSAATGAFTVFTTPTDKDFYLTSAQISISKSAACDLATGVVSLTVVISAQTKSILNIATVTLTAQQQSIALGLPVPIKLDRGSVISMSGTFGIAALSRAASIVGYTTDALSV